MFNDGNVINFGSEIGNFEGRVEVFSVVNMVIPYSAIMTAYESKNGISMVHSYSRAYSRYEVDAGNTISIGEEAC